MRTLRSASTFVAAIVASAALVSAQRAARTLDIYVVDVEGGNAALFVSPSGESLLIDTGNAGAGAARDAARIVEAAKDAGVAQIDHVITTHWHGDHYGGLAELASRMPIKHFIDHGRNIQPTEATDAFLNTTYPQLYAKATHTVAKPGDTIAFAGVSTRVVASAGQVIAKPLAGAGKPNPFCTPMKPVDAIPEDTQSVATLFTFGKFRAVHPGDLTRDKEYDLICPANRVGTVDVLVGPHHGQDTSNSEAFVHALQPRVIVMNNGTRKGGWPDVMKSFYTSPRFEDLWQMHFSLLSGQEYTPPGVFIANGVDDPMSAMPIAPLPAPGANAPPAPVHNGRAYWVKISARDDGTFTVTNSRNGFSKEYR
ncbi:MAG TPA: MBL fold metallo-hydrolase [Vicinamibacterales bacterium]|jgi:competence protein ComEC|nr:MBL fold metallo-hydrolase [Vicinamibacterales bacterium]